MELFEDFEGLPVPRISREWDGTERDADGERYMDAAQAAARYTIPEDRLARYHAFVFQDMVKRAEAAAYGAGALPPMDEAAHLLWRTRYAHVPVEDFRLLLAECQRRGLSAWSRHVWVKYQWNAIADRNEMRICVTIDGLRSLASKSGDFAGCDENAFEYADDQRIPVKATATVYRLVNGQRCKFTESAYWDEYFPGGEESDREEFWRTKPHIMLGKCAEARAIRRAFSESMEGLYTGEEIQKSPPRRQRYPQQGETAREKGAPSDDFPDTRFRFELRLLEYGFNTPEKRNMLVEHFRQQEPELYERKPKDFYAYVLRAVRTNPGKFGPDAFPRIG